MTLDGLEWQQISEWRWVLGIKVRGIVREPLAQVLFASGWIYRVGKKVDEGFSTPSLFEAIEAAEAALLKEAKS